MFENRFGFSVYVSTFQKQKEMLESLKGENFNIFTSFHIQEEWSNEYKIQAKEMCQWLHSNGYNIIADISKKTVEYFEKKSIIEVAKEHEIDLLRIDYGYTIEEMITILEKMPLAVNASTINEDEMNRLSRGKHKIYAMHNFYPRPETGLDKRLFERINKKIKEQKIDIVSFIPGDKKYRGPLYKGLPTLECHRRQSPYVSYLDMIINYGVNCVFVGDIELSDIEIEMIKYHCLTGIICLPVKLDEEYVYLVNQVLTIRVDSGEYAFRILESREYSKQGKNGVNPRNNSERKRGTITIDNINYGRYSGEVQIIKKNLSADDKVNVIGQISSNYLGIIDAINGGNKIKLILIK